MSEKDQEFYANCHDNVEQPIVDSDLVNDSSNNDKESRIEITNDVDERDDGNGEKGLYLKDTKIGKIRQLGEKHQYEMAEDFEIDNKKIYQKQPKAYVEGCDMGWC